MALPGGRLQAFDIAWDVVGQRWFRLLPEQSAAPGDYLHWSGPFYRWNTTCAVCHSTDLRKNYDLQANSFATTWAAVNVGCQACHGPGEAHLRWATEGGETSGLVVGFSDQSPGTEIEVCAPCHSRRQQIAEPILPGRRCWTASFPELLRDDLYHADGQIFDEVYVYGSFVQSPMYQAGVRCSDCHDPHSGALAAADNGLCTRCHSESPPERFATLKAGIYDDPSHHHHESGGPGAFCVDCHMPARTYMEIDPRRDHSFAVPRPDLSVTLGTPNACTGCHDDRDDAWAAGLVADWFGTARRDEVHFGEILQAARQGQAGAGSALAGLITDGSQPGIVRATALSLLPEALGPEAVRAYRSGLSDPNPLVRAAAVAALEPFPPDQRWHAAGHLLNDPRRAVRIAAAQSLAGTPESMLSAAEAAQLAAALDEARAAELIMAEQPQAHLNLGVLAAAQGRGEDAESSYRRALALAPDFAPALINLADLYRQQGREAEAAASLEQAVAIQPSSAEAHFALGLARVRQGQRSEAIESLSEAARLAPDTTRYAYALGLALNDQGRWAEATKVLRQAHERDPADGTVLVALATFYRDKGFVEQARVYARKLVALNPNDQAAQQLLESLR